MNFFPKVKTVVCDNEKAFNLEIIKSVLANEFGVEIFTVPPAHSTSNGQVERFHSTLAEIARCLKAEGKYVDTNELVLIALYKYNRTIHSVTGLKPIDIIHCISEKLRLSVKKKLNIAQDKDLSYHNTHRVEKNFSPGDKVFVKTNRRIGNKFSKRFVGKIVQKDMGSYVLIDNRPVHKDNLR